MNETLKIDKLEKRMEILEGKVDNTLEVLGEMNEELKKLNRGIYGDKDNKTAGLIERQEADERQLRNLEDRVSDIEKVKTVEKVKKDTVGSILEKALKVFGVIMMIYLVLKNVIGLDTLVDLIFKK